jgi:hypothetical protein
MYKVYELYLWGILYILSELSTRVHAVARRNQFPKFIKYFNGEAVPRLTNQLIDKLVHRFIIIFKVANMQHASKQKIPSFEFLTHKLLHIEGETRLAKSFIKHTRHDPFY